MVHEKSAAVFAFSLSPMPLGRNSHSQQLQSATESKQFPLVLLHSLTMFSFGQLQRICKHTIFSTFSEILS